MKFGPYDVSIVRDGTFRLDGGGMFGVVPRALWGRQHAPDADNRILLALNCLLLQGEGRTILVDCGAGDGWSTKDQTIYAFDRSEGGLVEDLARHGVSPADVTDVILTHLHFDHTGGVVELDGGEQRLRFPNATHWIQSRQLRWAREPTERDRASFRPDRWEALLAREDRVRVLEGETEFLPSMRCVLVNGHTPGQQLPLVEAEEGALLYASDLIPLSSHLRIPYIMSYDLNPVITLAEKKEILTRAVTENWTLVLVHDPVISACTVRATEKGFEVKDVVEL